MPFAERTTVSPEKTKAEIEQLLKRHGATGFQSGWDHADPDAETAYVMFRFNDRKILFRLTFPPQRFRQRDQEIRRRWRALLLVIKGKLESVAARVETVEEAFLPQTLLNEDGVTVWTLLSQAASFQSLAKAAGGQPLALPPAR